MCRLAYGSFPAEAGHGFAEPLRSFYEEVLKWQHLKE